MDTEVHAVERYVEAPPETVYALVADVERMGEWSPETYRCRWKDGATGPAVGARFKAWNRHGASGFGLALGDRVRRPRVRRRAARPRRRPGRDRGRHARRHPRRRGARPGGRRRQWRGRGGHPRRGAVHHHPITHGDLTGATTARAAQLRHAAEAALEP